VGAFVVGTSNCVSQPVQQKEGHFFSFTVLLRRMEMQEITAEVQIEFMNMPYNLTEPNLLVSVLQTQEYGEEYDKVEMQVVDPIGHYYRGIQTMAFHPNGNTEFYPMDEYVLNFTFIVNIPHDLINYTNTKVGIKCLIPGLDEYKEAGTSEDRFDVIAPYWKEGYQQVQLNTKIYLQRGFSSQLVMSVLFISFLLLGSLLLIKPDKLEQRLSACLTLFLFAISFTFTIQVPTALQARATFAETLTFILLIGAGLLSVISVIEKILLEEKPKLEILQYPIEGAILILLSLALHGQISHFIGIASGYPWLQSSSTTFVAFSAILIIAILYGYVSKTALFILRKRRKKFP
jgi:hypothetical protein